MLHSIAGKNNNYTGSAGRNVKQKGYLCGGKLEGKYDAKSPVWGQ
jgi:hypothetical protein